MNSSTDIRLLWDFSNPTKSRKNFEEEIKKYESENSFVLELKTQIARTYGLEGDFKKAHTLLDSIKSEIKEEISTETIRYYIEKGRVFNSDNKKQLAVIEFEKAYKISKEVMHEHLIVDSAHMLAIAETSFEKQKKWTEIAIDEANKAKDSKVKDWKGSLLNNWGWSLFEIKEYSEALKVFRGALSFRETKKNQEAIIIAKWAVARTLRALDRFDEALEIQLKLEKDWESLNKKDGYVYEELGELYLKINNKKISQMYFQKAYDELSKDSWFVKNESKRLTRIESLSK